MGTFFMSTFQVAWQYLKEYSELRSLSKKMIEDKIQYFASKALQDVRRRERRSRRGTQRSKKYEWLVGLILIYVLKSLITHSKRPSKIKQILSENLECLYEAFVSGRYVAVCETLGCLFILQRNIKNRRISRNGVSTELCLEIARSITK